MALFGDKTDMSTEHRVIKSAKGRRNKIIQQRERNKRKIYNIDDGDDGVEAERKGLGWVRWEWE